MAQQLAGQTWSAATKCQPRKLWDTRYKLLKAEKERMQFFWQGKITQEQEGDTAACQRTFQPFPNPARIPALCSTSQAVIHHLLLAQQHGQTGTGKGELRMITGLCTLVLLSLPTPFLWESLSLLFHPHTAARWLLQQLYADGRRKVGERTGRAREAGRRDRGHVKRGTGRASDHTLLPPHTPSPHCHQILQPHCWAVPSQPLAVTSAKGLSQRLHCRPMTPGLQGHCPVSMSQERVWEPEGKQSQG